MSIGVVAVAALALYFVVWRWWSLRGTGEYDVGTEWRNWLFWAGLVAGFAVLDLAGPRAALLWVPSFFVAVGLFMVTRPASERYLGTVDLVKTGWLGIGIGIAYVVAYVLPMMLRT
jgi:hypothetical protein